MFDRLNRLSRLSRVVLCGAVVLMTVPVLSTLGLSPAPLALAGLALYGVGWFFWVGFEAELRPVGAGALLFLLLGLAALLVWLVYHLALLVLVK